MNGQIFPITGSPQTITLLALPANGNSQNVTVSFTDDPGCVASYTGVFTAPTSCCTELKILRVDPDNKRITLKNFGVCSIQTLNYILRSGTSETAVFGTSIVSGSNFLFGGDQVTIQWNAWTPDAMDGDLALFEPGSDTSTPSGMIDYVQWGAAGNPNEGLAVSAGLWGAGDFVNDIAPFDFIGGPGDFGVEFWDQIPPSCSILSITAGNQTPCDGGDYTQEIIVTYENQPSTGFLRVNGMNFPITGSPQTVTLNPMATGLPVNVIAQFTAELTCQLTETALFTSPEPCTDCSITAISAGIQIPCAGNPRVYTQEIIVEYSNAPAESSLIVNGSPYDISSSPQSITLLGIATDLPVEVTPSFSLDFNCSLTETALFTAPLPCASCSISGLSAGSQTPCDGADNTYTQEVIVSYSGAPASGTLQINGQSFPITGSPQTVTLTGLISDGSSVDVTASFSADPACSLSVSGLFVAAPACNCPADFNKDDQVTVADRLVVLAETA